MKPFVRRRAIRPDPASPTGTRPRRARSRRVVAFAVAGLLALLAGPAGASAPGPGPGVPGPAVPGAAEGRDAAPVLGAHGGPAAPAASVGVSLEVPGTNERISVDPQGGQLSQTQSGTPAISDDGQRVVFAATAILPTGTTGSFILLRDRSVPTTTQIWPVFKVPFDLSQSNGSYLHDPTISGDGRWVAFVESSDGANTIDLWSAATGLQRPFGRRLGFSNLSSPSLSRDGRYLAFSGAPFATVAASVPSYYVVDLTSFVVTPVGFDETGGRIANNLAGGSIRISANGTYVAIEDSPLNDKSSTQVWRVRVGARKADLVTRSTSGGRSTGYARTPAINQDGSVIAFASSAADLVKGDTNKQDDVFTWTPTGGVTRISLGPGGKQASGGSDEPAITANGRQVAFASWAPNLVPGDSTGPLPPGTDAANPTDIFVLDRPTGRISRVSVGLGPSEPQGSSSEPAISASGRQVAFASTAPNLVDGDTNQFADVFLRERIPAITVATDPTSFGNAPVGGLTGVDRTVTVTSTGGFAATVTGAVIGGANATSFLVKKNGCVRISLYPGQSCTIQVTFLPDSEGQLVGTLNVTSTAPAAPAPITLLGGGGLGKITINPQVGPPGTVTIVTGSGFAIGQAISFAWSVGLTPTQLAPTVTDGSGNFVAQVLILPNDRTGSRQLSATPSLPTGLGTPATATFFVTTPTGQAPMFHVVQVFNDPFGRAIVLRR